MKIESKRVGKSSKQGKKEDRGNEGNGDEDVVSLQSLEGAILPPLPETDMDGLAESSPKERKMKMEDKHGAEEFEFNDKQKENNDNVKAINFESKTNASPTPPDGTLVSTPTKKRKRGRPRKNPLPHGNGCMMPPPAPYGQSAGMQAAAMMNPMNPANTGMLFNPQMIMQQRMFHNDLMQRAANTAKASLTMATLTPHMMAANSGVSPTMTAAPGGGGASKEATNNGPGYNCRIVMLDLPVDKHLGMVLDDDATYRKPELKRLAEDSPIKHQIPVEWQSKCGIGYMKSDSIGHVVPKTAKECVELIIKAKGAATATAEPVKMEMLLVQMQKPPHPKNNPLPPTKRRGRPPGSKNTYNPFQDWQKQYKAVVKYKEKHGNFNVHPSADPTLAHWVWAQRSKKKKNALGAKRVEKLNKIGFDWDGENIASISTDAEMASAAADQPPVSWKEMYKALERFKDRCGLFPTSGKLHEWMERQKVAVVDFTISPTRALQLLELGVEMFPSEFAEKLKCAAGVNFEDATGEKDEEMPHPKKRKVSQEVPQDGTSFASALFWKSAEAAKLFGFKRGDDVLTGLKERIELLKQANESVNGWKSLIPDDNREAAYSQNDIMVVRHKAQYLIKAYLVAMKHMNNESWGQCCKMATTELSELGLTKLSGGNGVGRWNAQFRIANTFPHPVRCVAERESYSFVKIFEFFPKAKEMFVEIANENKHRITGKFMQEEFKERVLPALEQESRENQCFDNGSREQKMLVRLIAHPPSEALVLSWMRQLNIEWDQWCTRRGRAKDGGSYLSQRMAEAWASGKYATRRPKGQGLKKDKKRVAENEEAGEQTGGDEANDIDGY